MQTSDERAQVKLPQFNVRPSAGLQSLLSPPTNKLRAHFLICLLRHMTSLQSGVAADICHGWRLLLEPLGVTAEAVIFFYFRCRPVTLFQLGCKILQRGRTVDSRVWRAARGVEKKDQWSCSQGRGGRVIFFTACVGSRGGEWEGSREGGGRC